MVTKTAKERQGVSGGLATLTRYGLEYYRRIGRMGGRPRSQTIDDIKRRTASSANDIKKEVMHGKGLPLKELKRLYAERRGF